MSITRKIYFARLVGRSLLLAMCAVFCAFRRVYFSVLDGMNFFQNAFPAAFSLGDMGHGYDSADHPDPEQGAAWLTKTVCQPFQAHS